MSESVFKILALLLFISAGCSQKTTKTRNSEEYKSMPVSYAEGFRIVEFPGYKKITVISPWQKSEGINIDYYLVPKSKNIPSELSAKQIIRTPVERIVCLSTSHIGFLKALCVTPSLKGLSGSDFVSDTIIQRAVKEGLVKDVGYDQGLNYEVILSLKPDLIMAYGVGGEVTGIINKLKDLKLNVLLNGEYLERTPLAKAEWIKLVGALYEKEKEANDYFNKIEESYLSHKNSVANAAFHPVVLTGLPFKDSWWMAGGKSNLAQLITDAGGEFLWKDNTSREAFVVSAEDVIMRGAKADFWINCGTVGTINELISADSRFSSFPQVKKKTIYNNNLAVNKNGGNDYWEMGVVRPDLILSDLIKILHPEVDSSKAFTFYKRID
jgi:iron complex transport system substrate-binding protein